MSGQFSKRPSAWEELPLGTRVYVSTESGYGLHDYSWRDGPKFLATVVSTHPKPDSCVLVMLDRANVGGSFSIMQSASARTRMDPKYVASVRENEHKFFWIASLEAVRLYDPTYLSEVIARGVHTCRCGAMNTDVSSSAIIDGRYVCYMCRVIIPRERAA